jgi:spore coat protein U-like protein
MRTRFIYAAAGLAACTAAAGGAEASSASGSLPVSLTIQGACSLQSAANLGFGAQTSVGANLYATSVIGVTCTNSTPYTVGLSAGTGSGATVAARMMMNGSASIPYAIYQDAGHSQVWGVTSGVDTQAGTGTGLIQSFTAYGEVPPVSNPLAGSYSDTISVTVSY